MKLIENFYGWQLKEFQRDHLRKLLDDLESSAGFSDDEPADSPRPVSNSPQETGKNSEFGPTELR